MSDPENQYETMIKRIDHTIVSIVAEILIEFSESKIQGLLRCVRNLLYRPGVSVSINKRKNKVRHRLIFPICFLLRDFNFYFLYRRK